MTLKLARSLTALATLSCALSAFGQILVPSSSVRNTTKPWVVHTDYVINQGPWHVSRYVKQIMTRQGAIEGNYPSMIRQAYGLPATGGSEAIAIIEAYDLPTSLNDFNVFASQFGLPTETSASVTAGTNQVLQVVYANGSRPASNASWGGEIALDMEWAHAIAPGAKIYVIECASDTFSDILVGVKAAASLPNVREVSMSFGSSESSNESSYDSDFTTANQVFFAAAGDTSNERDYPAASPNVFGVGGTSLTVAATGITEVAWSDGGGGKSAFEPLPSFQVGFTQGGRGIPDVAADADPNTGCAVYDSTPIPHQGSGWMVDGGTSLATPIEAAITNLRGSFSASSFGELVRQYGLSGTSNFRDIVTGTSGIYSAGPGYDYVTGLGAMINLFPNSIFAPSSLQVVYGTPIAGILDNVIQKDGRDYVLRSVPTGNTDQVYLSGGFSAPLNSGATRASASVSITGFTSAAKTTLSLYNFANQEWDTYTLSLQPDGSSLNVSLPNPNDYFDSNGNVQFQIQCQSSSPTVFQLGLDQIQLNVTTIS
jgi:kumamolisin